MPSPALFVPLHSRLDGSGIPPGGIGFRNALPMVFPIAFDLQPLGFDSWSAAGLGVN